MFFFTWNEMKHKNVAIMMKMKLLLGIVCDLFSASNWITLDYVQRNVTSWVQ